MGRSRCGRAVPPGYADAGGHREGVSEAESEALPDAEKDFRRAAVHERYAEAGADAGLNTLAELPDLIDELNEMLKGRA